jgi:hypothetical protein
VIVLAGLSGITLAGIGLWHSEVLLTHGFGKALQTSRPALSFGPAGASAQAAVAGDEGYWLTRAEVGSATPLARHLAVGDRITISGQDGRERQLQVEDLKAIGGAVRQGGGRLLLVTCRAVDAEGRDAGPVRFIVEAEPAEPALRAPDKAL